MLFMLLCFFLLHYCGGNICSMFTMNMIYYNISWHQLLWSYKSGEVFSIFPLREAPHSGTLLPCCCFWLVITRERSLSIERDTLISRSDFEMLSVPSSSIPPAFRFFSASTSTFSCARASRALEMSHLSDFILCSQVYSFDYLSKFLKYLSQILLILKFHGPCIWKTKAF